MSKQITWKWVPGQCRWESAVVAALSAEELADFIMKTTIREAKRPDGLIERLKNMHMLNLFYLDCHMCKRGAPFPKHYYPNANQEFLDDVEAYLSGETNIDFSKYLS